MDCLEILVHKGESYKQGQSAAIIVASQKTLEQ
jgi:hypothetical protein